jgi:hypothetical protein
VGVGGHDRVRHYNVHHVKWRGYKKLPYALRDAIAAGAIFGVLLLVHALL